VGTASDVDTDAAEQLFKTTYPKLAGWVRRLVDDEETAHEIAAEAFVRLIYGRLDAAHTPPVENVGVELDELRQIFPGF